MNKPAKAVVTRQQDLNTYAELWHASACVLRVGKAEPVASSWQFLSSLVLTAFAFEAYMNHVGEKVLAANWESSEHLPPSDKLDMICAALNVTLPWHEGRAAAAADDRPALQVPEHAGTCTNRDVGGNQEVGRWQGGR